VYVEGSSKKRAELVEGLQGIIIIIIIGLRLRAGGRRVPVSGLL